MPRPLAALLATTAIWAQSPPGVRPLGPGCGAAPTAVLTASLPVLGGEVSLAVADPHGRAFGALVLGTPGAFALGGCTAYFAPATPLVALPLSPALARTVALPRDAALDGAVVAAQAVLQPGTGALGVDLSSGVALTLGARRGPLASLPSPPGPHLAAIAALRPGEWLDLGAPAADPVFGRATGREYTPRLAWSGALGAAFLTGEGEHGYTIPASGRYVDDVWCYDLRGHRWLCVKPGSPVATLLLRLNADRFEETLQGELWPTAQLGHGYELVAFDDATQSFAMLPAPNTYWLGAMPQRLAWLGDPSLPAAQAAAPWVFDTVGGRWRRAPAGASAPAFNLNARAMLLHALPGGAPFWAWDPAPAHRRQVWSFDAATLAWTAVPTANDAPALSGNGVSCFEPARARVWVYGVESSGGAGLWCYDVRARRWSASGAVNTPPAPVIYTTKFAGLTFDPVADQLLLKYHDGAWPTFFVFDIAGDAWLPDPIEPPSAMQPSFRYQHVNACYAAGYGVHLLHASQGRDRTGRVVVYCHAR